MYGNGKLISGIIIGIFIAIGIFCISVSIGSVINGLSFTEQICNWFGSCNSQVVEETLEQAVESTAEISIA